MKRKNIITLSIVLALSATMLGYLIYIKFLKKDLSIKTKKINEETKKEAEQNDVQVVKDDANKVTQTDEKKPEQPSSVTVNISSAGFSNQTAFISAIVNGTTSGNCTLTMQNGTAIIEKKADIGLQISYYICRGFNIPSSELVPKGEWNAFITVNTPNGSAKSEVRKVNVQ